MKFFGFLLTVSVEFPDDGFDDSCARCHMTPSDWHLESVAGWLSGATNG